MTLKARLPILVSWLLIGAFALGFSLLGIARYESTFSHDWRDEAVNNQMMVNTAGGRILLSTVKGTHRHHRHFRPAFVLLSVPYVFFKDVRIWYVLVAFAGALGGLAAFRLGRTLLGTQTAGLLACAAWLCWPPLHEVTLGNLDPETLVAAAWLFAAMFYVEKRFWGYLAFAVLALCCKETQAPVLAAFGVVALFQKRSPRWWGASLVIGTAWFVLALWVVIPSYHPAFATVYNRFIGVAGADFPAGFFAALMHDPLGTLSMVFSREHVGLLVRILRPLGFLSLFSPLTLIGPASVVLQILLLKDPLPVRQTHMVSAILPFVFWSALEGIRRLGGWSARFDFVGAARRPLVHLTLLSLMLATAVVQAFGPGIFGLYQNYGREPFHGIQASNVLSADFRTPTPAERRVVEVLENVGPKEAVSANSRLLLLLSSRPEIYEFGMQKRPGDFASTQIVALWFFEVECRTCTYNYLTPQNLALAAQLVERGSFGVAALDEAFAVLVSRSFPPKNLRADPSLESPFLEQIKALAERLERQEGLLRDQPRK